MAATMPTLQRGSQGPAVAAWQGFLNVQVAPAPPLVRDGQFGPATLAATINYQSARGLTPDGIVGPQTWADALAVDPSLASAVPASSSSSSLTPASAGVSQACSPRLHRLGREVFLRVWSLAFPGETTPARAALQIAGAVACFEGSYGEGCYKNNETGERACDTNNMGAIQGNAPPLGGFLASDFDARTGKHFIAHYQRYASKDEGAIALLKLLDRYAGDEMRAGDIDGFSTAMYVGAHRGGTLLHPAGYFGGIHVPKSTSDADLLAASHANINDHAAHVLKEATAVATAMGEGLEARRGGPAGTPPTSSGSTGLEPPATPREGSGGGGGLVVLALGLGLAFALSRGA